MCLLYVIAHMNMYVMFLLRQRRLNKLICNRCNRYVSTVTLLHGNMQSTHRMQFLKYTVLFAGDFMHGNRPSLQRHHNVTTTSPHVCSTCQLPQRVSYTVSRPAHIHSDACLEGCVRPESSVTASTSYRQIRGGESTV